MTDVLNWKYERCNDIVLKAINSKNFNSRSDLADFLGMNIKTLGRRIRLLKESGKLVIHRYMDNNFIYMIGKDAEFGWNAYEAKEILAFRNEAEDLGHKVYDPSSMKLHSIYDADRAPSLHIGDQLASELDACVDELFPG